MTTKTKYIFLFFQVNTETAQAQSKMEALMNSVSERIRRAREERRTAETENVTIPNPTAQTSNQEPIPSLSSSEHPKVARAQSSSAANCRKRKRNNDAAELVVKSISDFEWITDFLVPCFQIHCFLLLYNKEKAENVLLF